MSAESPVAEQPSARIATCPNCGARIEAPYCGSCGQLQKNINRTIWSLVGELLDDVLRIDSRIVQTMLALMFRPGFLTTEYFAGRRARYTHPVRLYLIISFLFFFLMPALNTVSSIQLDDDPSDVQLEEQRSEAEQTQNDEDELSVNMALPILTAEENAAASRVIENQVYKARDLIEENPSAALDALMDKMSVVMFFMLPVFAIFLKLSYLGSGVYYAEHLLLAVHNHCFLYVALLLSALLENASGTAISVATETVDSLLVAWMLIYMFLSLKTTYQQSFRLTLFKFFLLGLIYLLLTLIGVLIAMFVGVMTL